MKLSESISSPTAGECIVDRTEKHDILQKAPNVCFSKTTSTNFGTDTHNTQLVATELPW